MTQALVHHRAANSPRHPGPGAKASIAIIAVLALSGGLGASQAQAQLPPPPPPPPGVPPLPGGSPPVSQERRLAPVVVTLTARPRHDRTSPYRFTLSGRLRLADGMSSRNGCRGQVLVQVKRGSKVMKGQRVRVTSNCTYRVTVALRLAGRGRLSATARFQGNRFVKAGNADAISLRYGR